MQPEIRDLFEHLNLLNNYGVFLLAALRSRADHTPKVIRELHRLNLISPGTRINNDIDMFFDTSAKFSEAIEQWAIPNRVILQQVVWSWDERDVRVVADFKRKTVTYTGENEEIYSICKHNIGPNSDWMLVRLGGASQ